MASISELVTDFMVNQRPIGNLLDVDIVTSQCLASTKLYAGYSDLEEWLSLPITIPPTPYPTITDATDLSDSEWAIIKPLFLLYLERENALYMESSRTLGIEAFGRASSEVAGDITAYELEMHHKAFCIGIITI